MGTSAMDDKGQLRWTVEYLNEKLLPWFDLVWLVVDEGVTGWGNSSK